MTFIWWIIVGGLAGALAKLVMPGRDPGGIIITILLGIAGAVVAGWLGRALNFAGPDTTFGAIVSAAIGAFIILALYRVIRSRR